MNIVLNQRSTTIETVLKQSTAISWMSPSPSSPNQWNLSTTKEHYLTACKEIDNTIRATFTGSSTNYTYNQTTLNPMQVSPTTKNYLAALTASIPTHTPTTTTTTQTPTPSGPYNLQQFRNLFLLTV